MDLISKRPVTLHLMRSCILQLQRIQHRHPSINHRRGRCDHRAAAPAPISSEVGTRFDTKFDIFDSGKNSKCRLTTRRPNILTWYSCGPTVYASAHIGHASSFIRQDVIRRIIEHLNKDLTTIQVMGITDIDDKIIRKSNQSGEEWKSLSRRYENEFIGDLSSLGVRAPNLFTRVSDFIPQIIEFVGKLVSTGYAYPVEDGSVYFDSQKYGNKYGIFRQVTSEEEDEEEQNEEDLGKKNVRDFALWKGAKPEEPYWESQWGSGRGRPGWHIECSVMASQIFGNSLDLHTGGKDLMFPHHENEEAQCCAHFQSPHWTSHWLHMGHLHFKGDDVKMSKSLGNTVSIRNFLDEYSPKLLRLMCIISRYRKNIEYSSGQIENAQNVLRKLQTFSSDAIAILNGQKNVSVSADGNASLWEKLQQSTIQLNDALHDDFDTPEALKILVEFITNFNRQFDNVTNTNSADYSDKLVNFELVIASKLFVEEFLSLVGLLEDEKLIGSETSSRELGSVVDNFVKFRNVVRSFSLCMDEADKTIRKGKIKERAELLKACDLVRDKLLEDKIEIKDHGKLSSWNYLETVK